VVESIEKALYSLEGIIDVEIELKKKKVFVENNS
jgi:copper chaperone CopZ